MAILTRHFRGIILFLCLTLLIGTEAISLDNSGYYKIVVAIDERTVQNSIQDYVDNIKMGIQDLSDLLNHATKGKFSIDEADILVPEHWNVTTDGVATSQSYNGADIKISHVFTLPFVNNHNPCGFPGVDIQLPYNFFDHGDNGIYGRLGKAMLVQFARLRFGVWEEVGYPGDLLFPYYWKPLVGAEDWEVNACTDVPIRGTYKNINDGTPCGPDPEDTEKLYPPPSDCRFYPDTSQEAKSSLMSYHYLPTFESFCDSETHDKSKPTPQNFYCRYKSVMEVMEESFDWRQTVNPNVAKRIEFKVVKNSPTPLLYILLDSGITDAPSTALSQISNHLSTFISSRELRNLFVGVGKFPAEESGYYSDVIPWSIVRDNTSQYIYAFENTFGQKTGFKNYAGAIKELINLLNNRQHAPGSAILIVKTSSEPFTDGLTPESEVLMAALLADVKIFAIEAHGNPFQSVDALERISTKSEGSHLHISKPQDLELLEDFFKNLTTILQSPIVKINKYFLGLKEPGAKDGPISFKITSKITRFEAFLMPLIGTFNCDPKKDPSYCPEFIRGKGNFDNVTFKVMDFWDSSSQPQVSKMSLYFSSETLKTPLGNLSWESFDYSCSGGECSILVVILAQVEDPAAIPSDIKISVTTSAINNLVDMSVSNAGSDIGAAFAIYAKLEQDGMPLEAVEGFVVTAIVKSPNKAYTVELKDNGNSAPDITTNDGIFSAPFVVAMDGLHEIFVTAVYRTPDAQLIRLEEYDDYWIPSSNSAGKLFPIDQGSIGCGSGYIGCSSKVPDVDFVATVELEGLIEFTNFAQFVPVAERIIDLVVTPLGGNWLSLEWTDPGCLLNPTQNGQGDFYEIRHQDNFENLIFDWEHAENIPANVLTSPKTAGSRQNITYDFGREADRYYAIRTMTLYTNTPVYSSLSVIVGVNIKGEVITTTTTTTTTVRPTTTSTLPPPTIQPWSSTTEDDEATTTPTTPRTTLKRSTTAKPTLPTTTTEKPTTTLPNTTTEASKKHWFATTEGIITISVFGAGVLFISAGGLTYLWFSRFR